MASVEDRVQALEIQMAQTTSEVSNIARRQKESDREVTGEMYALTSTMTNTNLSVAALQAALEEKGKNDEKKMDGFTDTLEKVGDNIVSMKLEINTVVLKVGGAIAIISFLASIFGPALVNSL